MERGLAIYASAYGFRSDLVAERDESSHDNWDSFAMPISDLLKSGVFVLNSAAGARRGEQSPLPAQAATPDSTHGLFHDDEPHNSRRHLAQLSLNPSTALSSTHFHLTGNGAPRMYAAPPPQQTIHKDSASPMIIDSHNPPPSPSSSPVHDSSHLSPLHTARRVESSDSASAPPTRQPASASASPPSSTAVPQERKGVLAPVLSTPPLPPVFASDLDRDPSSRYGSPLVGSARKMVEKPEDTPPLPAHVPI